MKKTKRLVLTISETTSDLLNKKAQEKGLSISAFVRLLLHEKANLMEKKLKKKQVFVLLSEDEYEKYQNILERADWEGFLRKALS